MNCACAVSNDMDNDAAWGCREIKRAGKIHKCCECFSAIEPGTSYFYHTVFAEGTVSNFKVCPDCQSVIWQFFKNGWYFETVWDSLTDYLYDNWKDDLPSSCICQLTPVARDKVCDILDEIYAQEK